MKIERREVGFVSAANRAREGETKSDTCVTFLYYLNMPTTRQPFARRRKGRGLGSFLKKAWTKVLRPVTSAVLDVVPGLLPSQYQGVASTVRKGIKNVTGVGVIGGARPKYTDAHLKELGKVRDPKTGRVRLPKKEGRKRLTAEELASRGLRRNEAGRIVGYKITRDFVEDKKKSTTTTGGRLKPRHGGGFSYYIKQ